MMTKENSTGNSVQRVITRWSILLGVFVTLLVFPLSSALADDEIEGGRTMLREVTRMINGLDSAATNLAEAREILDEVLGEATDAEFEELEEVIEELEKAIEKAEEHRDELISELQDLLEVTFGEAFWESCKDWSAPGLFLDIVLFPWELIKAIGGLFGLGGETEDELDIDPDTADDDGGASSRYTRAWDPRNSKMVKDAYARAEFYAQTFPHNRKLVEHVQRHAKLSVRLAKALGPKFADDPLLYRSAEDTLTAIGAHHLVKKYFR